MFDPLPPPPDEGFDSVADDVHRDGINLAVEVNFAGLVLTNLPIKPDAIFCEKERLKMADN